MKRKFTSVLSGLLHRTTTFRLGPDSRRGLASQKTRLFERRKASRGDLFQFGKQFFIGGFKIETGLALHPRLQFCRQAVAQFGKSINSHMMKADVVLADLHPSDGHRRFARGMNATGQAITTGRVLRDGEGPGIRLKDLSQPLKNGLKFGGHTLQPRTFKPETR